MTAKKYLDALADENGPAPSNPPIAAFSGKEAAGFAAMLMDDSVPAADMFAAMKTAGRRGRPAAQEKREKSVQERFRLPESWSSYIDHAAKRDGFANKSDYLRSLVMADAEAHHEERRLQLV